MIELLSTIKNAVVVLGLVALLPHPYSLRTNHTCVCQGSCKPNPCSFAWNPQTGEVDLSKLYGATSSQ
jgi:hypothetical protein